MLADCGRCVFDIQLFICFSVDVGAVTTDYKFDLCVEVF
jgi:hypothetical protein